MNVEAEDNTTRLNGSTVPRYIGFDSLRIKGNILASMLRPWPNVYLHYF